MGVTIYESCRHGQIWIKHGRMMAEWVKYGCNLYGGWKTRSNSVVTFMEEYRHACSDMDVTWSEDGRNVRF